MKQTDTAKAHSRPAEASGTFLIVRYSSSPLGSTHATHRDGVWGERPIIPTAIAVLRRAIELGINLIDTADSYGPIVSECLIAEALHPYPAISLIATKAAFNGPT